MSRRSVAVLILIALMLSDTAVWLTCCGVTGGHPHRRALPNVSPMDEQEILDPRVDPAGKPRAQIFMGANGLDQIEIPPTVFVHCYYTGDRDFQRPMMPGGPVLITANDPATGEQTQIEALLPPGAPRITYRSDCLRLSRPCDHGEVRSSGAARIGASGQTDDPRDASLCRQARCGASGETAERASARVVESHRHRVGFGRSGCDHERPRQQRGRRDPYRR